MSRDHRRVRIVPGGGLNGDGIGLTLGQTEHVFEVWEARQIAAALSDAAFQAAETMALRSEMMRLRALVTRLTDAAENLARELPDPGSEALAAIHCGRHFIYG